MIGHIIEVELRVLPVVDGRRDRLVADRPDAGGRLDRRGRAKAVAQGPLDRADGQAMGVIAENGLEHPGLNLVVQRGARAVSIVVVDRIRRDASRAKAAVTHSVIRSGLGMAM